MVFGATATALAQGAEPGALAAAAAVGVLPAQLDKTRGSASRDLAAG